MPENGVELVSHRDALTSEEFVMVCKAAVSLGISKIRVTGGEPLVKKNIINILKDIRKIDGLSELCLTTNGVLLKKYAKDLKDAGVDRLNISIDSCDKERYRYITRIGDVSDVREGIDEAIKCGFKKIKINTVLIGGINDVEIEDMIKLTYDNDIDVRFIELMPIVDNDEFTEKNYVSGKIVLDKLKDCEEIDVKDSVAKLYHIKGAKGNIGIITPLSNLFCKDCNRIRVTFDGKVKPCLHSDSEYNLKGLDVDGIKKVLEKAILDKPKEHKKLDYHNRSDANRNMNMIGG